MLSVHENTKAYMTHGHGAAHSYAYSRSRDFPFPLWLLAVALRSLQMKRAWSEAEGPSINNKQQLSCEQPSVSSGT